MKDILITSTVLILAILLIRFLFRSTISRRTQYALWLLVALRLLVPVSIGSSGWSVVSVTDKLPEREISENIVTVVGGDVPQLAPRVPDPSLPEAEQRELYREYQQEWKNEVDRTKIETGGTPITVQDILRIVRYGGMAAMVLWFLAAYIRFDRRLRRTRVLMDGAESRYPVYLCDDIPSPCLFGLFRPAIYVTSAAAKDENRLRCVIAHEETHARHLDPLWSLLRGACLTVWWFDPLVWLAAHCAKADCELACDEDALARLGESERASYGETLLALIPVRRGGDPMLAATTMTAGKRQMKDRITRIAEHKRPVAIALALVLALTGAVCAATFTGAERKNTEPTKAAWASRNASGAYASVEDYVDAVRAGMTTVTYHAVDTDTDDVDANGSVKTANVLDTRVAFLEKRGEVSDLAPDGTLELYRYEIETKLDAPLTDITLVGGMYATEDGWCDLEGQGGHALIVLRRADGSVDALHDAPCNDDMGGIWYYQNSESEALYDWAVQYYGLDLPLYAVYLIGSPISSESVPANRVDGDGWYVYVPVRTWWYRADEGDTARWYSRYDTGSMLSVRHLASADECDLAPHSRQWGRTVDGKVKTLTYEDEEAITTAYLYDASDGGYWQVLTRYYFKTDLLSDMRGLEPGVLYAMARSFTVTANASPRQDAALLPRYEYQGDDPYLAAVCEWSIRGEERSRYEGAEVSIPCPLIADVDDSEAQDIRVWGNFWSFSYTPRATTLFCVSGGERPGLLHLRAVGGGYEVFQEEMVGDGEAYGKDMQRIFGALRLMKLDSLDRKEVRARFIEDYVSRNALPFTQYQDYGRAPVQLPGAPETPEAAQLVRYAAPSGWSIDYDLREFSVYGSGALELYLGGVGEWQGIGIDIEQHPYTDAAALATELSEQMEQPTRTETAVGADNTPATLLRDVAAHGGGRDVYVVSLPDGGCLSIRVSNTYYNAPDDPVLPGADAVLHKTLATFRLTDGSAGAAH